MKKWYVVNTYSGHENKVRTTLERRIDSMGLDRNFGEIRIPTESVIEIKDGKKVPTIQRQFPGYVLVNMDMNDTTWRLVRQTPGVTQIVGAGEKPLALSRAEVERLLHPGEVETREKEVAVSSVPRLSYKYTWQIQTREGSQSIISTCKDNSSTDRTLRRFTPAMMSPSRTSASCSRISSAPTCPAAVAGAPPHRGPRPDRDGAGRPRICGRGAVARRSPQEDREALTARVRDHDRHPGQSGVFALPRRRHGAAAIA